MPFADTLKAVRETRGYSQVYIADLLGIDKSTYNGYESGKRKPDVQRTKELANLLNVSADYLLGTNYNATHPTPDEAAFLFASKYEKAPAKVRRAVEAVLDIAEEEPEAEVIPFPQKRMVPCYNSAAGVGDPEPDEQPEAVETDNPRADFAVHIIGNSMEPLLADGSIVFGTNRKPDDGQIGAFRLDGEFTVKQVVTDSEGNTYLFATNPSRQDANQEVWHDSGRDLWCFGTILCDPVPLPD